MLLLHVKYYTQKSGFVKGQEERKFDFYFKTGNVPTGKIREFRQASRGNAVSRRFPKQKNRHHRQTGLSLPG